MGIEDEINRQNAEDQKKFDALFGIPSELDDTQKKLKPLIDRLEGAREDKFQNTGRWTPTQDSAFRTGFASVWTEGLPNLMDYVKAAFEPDMSGIFFKADLSSGTAKAPGIQYSAPTNIQIYNGDYYLPTQSLHLRYENGAVHVYKGWLKANLSPDGRVSVQIQQRLGGKYHDLETAYEQIFPVYAQHVFHEEEDQTKADNAIKAIAEVWQARNARADQAAQAHGAGPQTRQQTQTAKQTMSLADWIGTFVIVIAGTAAFGVAAIWAIDHFGL